MEDLSTTLRIQLTQKKSQICFDGKTGNSINSKWVDIQTINVWSDFNLTNLSNTYYHLLEQPLLYHPLYPQFDNFLVGPDGTENTNDLNCLVRWNNALMQQTLDAVKEFFTHTQGYALSCECSAVAGPKGSKVKASGPGGKVGVNHIIALNKTPKQNLVIGLSRPSSKFSLGEIMCDSGPLDVGNSGHVWVLRQLGHYCKTANTRYGYIQTEKELVVCKFERTLTNDKLCVHVMPIPWTNHGPTVLTTDLALWWLCVKALSLPAGPQIEHVSVPDAPLPTFPAGLQIEDISVLDAPFPMDSFDSNWLFSHDPNSQFAESWDNFETLE